MVSSELSQLRFDVLREIDVRFPFRLQPPHPGQTKFLANFSANYEKVIHINSCGNSYGKTHLMCNIIINMCYPSRLRTFDCPLFTDYDKYRALSSEIPVWIIGTAENIRPGGAIYNQMRELDNTVIFREYKRELVINGQVIKLKTHDQDISAFGGVRAFAIFVDEPMFERIFSECVMRLTGKGKANKMLIFATPVTMRAGYLVDYSEHPDCEFTYGSIYENPHADDNTIKSIERIIAMNPDERDARLYGKPRALQGAVFKTFDIAEHVIKELPQISGDKYNYYVGIDPHNKKQCFAVLLAVDANSQVYVLDEFPSENWSSIKSSSLTIKQQVDAIKEMVRRYTDKEFTSYGDKIFFNTTFNTRDGQSNNALEYYKAGLSVVTDTVNMDWQYRISCINEYLYFSDEEFPALHIMENCKNIITAFTRFRYNENKERVMQSIGSQLDGEWECPISALSFCLTSNLKAYNSSPRIESSYVGTMPLEGYEKESKRQMLLRRKAHKKHYLGTFADANVS